jgi:bis(5'-nucleosyl)-tetraphosphatase (symmetrical)
MATFAVGDVQGCYEEFARLLDRIDFQTGRDQLWLLGDLINRGTDNLSVVRRVMAMGDSAIVVLGNHDLHYLAIHRGGHSPNRGDTFTDLLRSRFADEVSDWYRHQRFFHRDKSLGYVMAHAGIPHLWKMKLAKSLAAELEEVIQGAGCERYFRDMYGNEPNVWRDDLDGIARWRVVTNYFTRMRLVDAEGVLNFSHKGALEDAPVGLSPWFAFERPQPMKQKILFGHWAALEGHTGDERFVSLDTGCVWGRSLTALRLEDGQLFQVESVKQAV